MKGWIGWSGSRARSTSSSFRPGVDTFSKLTLDKILKKVKAAQDITIYTVSTGGFARADEPARRQP